MKNLVLLTDPKFISAELIQTYDHKKDVYTPRKDDGLNKVRTAQSTNVIKRIRVTATPA